METLSPECKEALETLRHAMKYHTGEYTNEYFRDKSSQLKNRCSPKELQYINSWK